MKGFPYVPWYDGDFQRSTAGWTLQEQAVYWRLLVTQWDIGTLPEDPARLAAIVRLSLEEFQAFWPLVGKKFRRVRGGLSNKRMEQHRTDYMKYRREQAERGRKGLDARWGKRATSNVIEMRRDALDKRHE